MIHYLVISPRNSRGPFHIFYSQRKAGLEAAKAIYKVGYRHAYQSCCQASFRDGGTPLQHI